MSEHDDEPASVSLRTLCGRYVVVYDPEDDIPEFQSGSSADTLTLRSRESISRTNPHPDGLKGEFSFGTVSGRFCELRAVTSGGGGNIPNCWELTDIVDWKFPDEGDRPDSICILVAKVKDDHGNPFVVIELACGRMDATWLAKKQESVGVNEFLTDAEKERLGMGLTGKKVQRTAKEQQKIGGKKEASRGGGAAKRKADAEDVEEKPRKKASRKK
ncbi:hypothetical protein SCP_1401830 [Sparassis crispa]|uniref:Uncharacterized protein n=1 Tax=Sparassis crispa TaxID=139825 RepID=A0A401H2Y0_9APHY|nr:hypothetical protein SCP_1401830 [Sparassis crispa]GBE88778.1 hypothetical protein SCP_1401830 [Sparassis crispa]